MSEFEEMFNCIYNNKTDTNASIDILMQVAMSSMMIWMIRKNISIDEREEFLKIALKQMRKKLLSEYDEVSSEPVKDLLLVDQTQFTQGLDKHMSIVEFRLRELLFT